MELTLDVIEPQITKQFLLEKHSQETYMEYYLGIPVKHGLFKSPLRVDHKATCSFFRNKSGDLIFKDFSGHFYGNFIDVVKFKFDCSYYKALQIIANDFGFIKREDIKKSSRPIVESQTTFQSSGPSKIQIEVQPFSNAELSWWEQYGISEEILKKFRVYSCKSVFLNDAYFAGTSRSQKIFGYYRGKDTDGMELWRIYFPGRKSFKFISNWKASMLQGYKQLPKEGELLVVTKSLKDVMVLYSLGITAVAPCSENLFMSEAQFASLKERFKTIVAFYDVDIAGLSNMIKIRNQFNIQCFWIPRFYKAKDISDFYAKYGREKTIELINEAKQKLK